MSGIEHKMQTAPARSLLKTWKAVGQRGKRDGSNRPFLNENINMSRQCEFNISLTFAKYQSFSLVELSQKLVILLIKFCKDHICSQDKTNSINHAFCTQHTAMDNICICGINPSPNQLQKANKTFQCLQRALCFLLLYFFSSRNIWSRIRYYDMRKQLFPVHKTNSIWLISLYSPRAAKRTVHILAAFNHSCFQSWSKDKPLM